MSAVSKDTAQLASLTKRASAVAEVAKQYAEYADEKGRLAEPVVEAPVKPKKNLN